MEQLTYTLYWLTGKSEKVQGTDIANAMTKAGYGNGALRALDFYSVGQCTDYKWNGSKWELTEEAKQKMFS